MKPGTVRMLVYAALAIGVILVALSGREIVVVLLSAAVAAGVAIWVHRRLAARDAQAEAGETEQAPDATDAWIGHLQGLVRLNIDVREHGLPAATTEKLEQTIDVLRRLIPELNDNYVGSELTWTVNRMATNYLPRIVTPYVALAPPARTEHEAELLKSLVGLESELANIAGLVRDAKVGEFKTKAAFLRARFLDGDLG